MNSIIKIGIVEDELLIAEKIKMILCDVGYDICKIVTDFNDAVSMITLEKPDLILLDIQIKGDKDGIDIAHYLRKHYNVPFIFLTANSDDLTLARAKDVRPWAYIVKPFTKEDLYTAIEIVFSNYKSILPLKDEINPGQKLLKKDFIFIKDGHAYHKIFLKEILYLKSDANYVIIFTAGGKKIMVRDKLDDFMKQLDADFLTRIHRSFSVNVLKIDIVLANEISISNTIIPIGNVYRQNFLKILGIDSNT